MTILGSGRPIAEKCEGSRSHVIVRLEDGQPGVCGWVDRGEGKAVGWAMDLRSAELESARSGEQGTVVAWDPNSHNPNASPSEGDSPG